MRVYKLSDKKNQLYFTNYNRVDEEIVFNQVKDILSKNPIINIGDKTIGPSEDIYNCTISGQSFELIFDIDYGGLIHSNSQKTLKILEDIINE